MVKSVNKGHSLIFLFHKKILLCILALNCNNILHINWGTFLIMYMITCIFTLCLLSLLNHRKYICNTKKHNQISTRVKNELDKLIFVSYSNPTLTFVTWFRVCVNSIAYIYLSRFYHYSLFYLFLCNQVSIFRHFCVRHIA